MWTKAFLYWQQRLSLNLAFPTLIPRSAKTACSMFRSRTSLSAILVCFLNTWITVFVKGRAKNRLLCQNSLRKTKECEASSCRIMGLPTSASAPFLVSFSSQWMRSINILSFWSSKVRNYSWFQSLQRTNHLKDQKATPLFIYIRLSLTSPSIMAQMCFPQPSSFSFERPGARTEPSFITQPEDTQVAQQAPSFFTRLKP